MGEAAEKGFRGKERGLSAFTGYTQPTGQEGGKRYPRPVSRPAAERPGRAGGGGDTDWVGGHGSGGVSGEGGAGALQEGQRTEGSCQTALPSVPSREEAGRAGHRPVRAPEPGAQRGAAGLGRGPQGRQGPQRDGSARAEGGRSGGSAQP